MPCQDTPALLHSPVPLLLPLLLLPLCALHPGVCSSHRTGPRAGACLKGTLPKEPLSWGTLRSSRGLHPNSWLKKARRLSLTQQDNVEREEERTEVRKRTTAQKKTYSHILYCILFNISTLYLYTLCMYTAHVCTHTHTLTGRVHRQVSH